MNERFRPRGSAIRRPSRDVRVAIVSLLAACSQSGSAPPPDAAAAPARTDGSAPEVRPVSCGLMQRDANKMCVPGKPCPSLRAWRFACEGYSIDGFDLAVTGAGRVFFLPTSNHKQAYLVDIPPGAAPEVTHIGPAYGARVAIGPGGDDDPRVLSYTDKIQLHRRTPAGFSAEPVALRGVPRGFAVNRAGEWLALMAEQDSNLSTLYVARQAGGAIERLPPVVSTLAYLPTSAGLSLGADDQPVVNYATDGAEPAVRRWSLDGDREIGRWREPQAYARSFVILPDGRPVLLWIDGSRSLRVADGATEHAVFEGIPWMRPQCGGGYIANYPDICMSMPRNIVQVGEQIGRTFALTAARTGDLADLHVAALSGRLEVGCRTTGSCIETMPCHCGEHDYETLQRPLTLRIRGAGEPAPELTLNLGDTPDDALMMLATDDAGRLYLVWRGYFEVNLAVIEAP